MSQDSSTPHAGRGSSTVDSHPAPDDLHAPVLEALLSLPVPLLARRRNGSVLFANEAARQALRLDADELAGAQVTRVQAEEGTETDVELPPSPSEGGPASFLLSLNQRLQRRIRAQTCEIELSPGQHQELLALEPLEQPEGPQLQAVIRLLEQRSDAVQTAANTLLWNHANRKMERWNHSARRLKSRVREMRSGIRKLLGISLDEQARDRLGWAAPRPLLADLARRARKHGASSAPFRIRLDHDLDRGERLARVDPVDVARVVLTGIDLLTEQATGGELWLRATEAGCRLRIVVDGSELDGADETPNLRRRQATVRELTPILRAHQATFEVHRDGHGHRKVILTLPTHPGRDAPPDSPGSPLPFPETGGL